MDHIKNRIPLPKNPVVITFDDGFKNNFDNAFPILLKYNATAVFFLITDYVDSKKVSWDNNYYYLTSKIGLEDLINEFKIRFSKLKSVVEKTPQDDIRETIRLLLKYRLEENIREEFVRNLYKKYEILINIEEIEDLYLSWKEINIMNDSGFLFGSHSSSHRVLSMLSSAEAKNEFINSKETIKTKANIKTDLFAYPYGSEDSYKEYMKKILFKNNYVCAVTTLHGSNNRKSDLYELKRICIIDEPLYYFKLRVEGFGGFIERIYQKLSKIFTKNNGPEPL